MRAAKVQASLRIRAVSPEPSLLTHTSSESRGTVRQKARSLTPLNGWACAVKVCHDGMLEDTNSLDGAHIRKDLPEFQTSKSDQQFESMNFARLQFQIVDYLPCQCKISIQNYFYLFTIQYFCSIFYDKF